MPEKPGEKPIVTITPEEAEGLIKKPWPDNILDLDHLTQLDAETARILVKGDFCLELNGLAEIDAATAEVLATNEGVLSLNGIVQPDVPVAEALAKKGDNLYLNGITYLSAGVAKVFCDHYQFGDLSMEGLTTVEREAIPFLQKMRGRLFLHIPDEIENLCDEFALTEANEGGDVERPEVDHWQPLFDKHPNFKDLVVGESAEIQQYLKGHGVAQPERFHNLNAGRGGEALIAEVLQFVAEQPNGRGWAVFSEMYKNRTRKDFEADPTFMTVYLDETYQAFSDYLNHIVLVGQREHKGCDGGRLMRSKAVLEEKMNDPQIADRIKRRYRKDLERLLSKGVGEKSAELENRVGHAQEILTKMNVLHLRRKGAVSYQLGSRSTKDLTLGDRCSDCTSAKIHGMNFWTVPTWATDPGFNFLLQYDEDGKLAHKFGLVWELKAEKGKQVPILTIDSLELANEQKKKPGMDEGPFDEKKEERLMNEAMAFIRSWAADMGLDSKALYSATISNTGTMELDEKYPKKELTITKLGALDASRRILKKTNPDYDGQVKVYLQSLVTEGEQIGGNAEEEGGGGDNGKTLIEGERAKDFSKVEGCIDQFLRSDSKDVSRVRGILELARTDSGAAARQMRIFLATQAQKETKDTLVVDGKRIDVFLHSRGQSLEAYLRAILGQTDVSRGVFVKANLFHLVPKKK